MSSTDATYAAGTAPAHHLVIREHGGAAFWEAKWMHRRPDGIVRQVKRRIGPAWVRQDAETGEWVKRPGRTPSDHLDRRSATVAADDVVRHVDAQLYAAEVDDRARRDAPVTFREIAADYMVWLEHVQDAKPSTLHDSSAASRNPARRTPAARARRSATSCVRSATGLRRT